MPFFMASIHCRRQDESAVFYDAFVTAYMRCMIPPGGVLSGFNEPSGLQCLNCAPVRFADDILQIIMFSSATSFNASARAF